MLCDVQVQMPDVLYVNDSESASHQILKTPGDYQTSESGKLFINSETVQSFNSIYQQAYD